VAKLQDTPIISPLMGKLTEPLPQYSTLPNSVSAKSLVTYERLSKRTGTLNKIYITTPQKKYRLPKSNDFIGSGDN
jgi:hypothetical protein